MVVPICYLNANPSKAPGFIVKNHLVYLLAQQERLEAGEELRICEAKYGIEARKPGGGAKWLRERALFLSVSPAIALDRMRGNKTGADR